MRCHAITSTEDLLQPAFQFIGHVSYLTHVDTIPITKRSPPTAPELPRTYSMIAARCKERGQCEPDVPQRPYAHSVPRDEKTGHAPPSRAQRAALLHIREGRLLTVNAVWLMTTQRSSFGFKKSSLRVRRLTHPRPAPAATSVLRSLGQLKDGLRAGAVGGGAAGAGQGGSWSYGPYLDRPRPVQLTAPIPSIFFTTFVLQG